MILTKVEKKVQNKYKEKKITFLTIKINLKMGINYSKCFYNFIGEDSNKLDDNVFLNNWLKGNKNF